MAVEPSDHPTTIEIPAQSGAIVHLLTGQRLRIIDVEGAQIADLFAALSDNTEEYLSTAVTRGANWSLFPKVGGAFVSNAYRPLLTLERDDSPGVHDMLAPPCSPEMYAAMGFEGHHPSCSENFRIAAAKVDWSPLHVPDPVDLFQNTPVDKHGSITPLPALTKPGDSITLRAEAPVYVVVTACSMDLEPVNGDRCTSVRLEVEP
ncbi:MAG: DUF1989 domain-containing protein [Mycolicibacterium sp.]|uniref:DUF1989 domain-containing protein n=1 Tax=Mycolicibacterium sp. TaxID=2320850 RepID=UPI003D0FED92